MTTISKRPLQGNLYIGKTPAVRDTTPSHAAIHISKKYRLDLPTAVLIATLAGYPTEGRTHG